ncbi:MAG TPA: hypothetical protein DDX47_05865 [Candidatus Jacksonbacteria bacterium]|nr:MAG: hypothetical protein UW45_C0042G0010 [Parcubacteria group bacterium GW2011_GWC2_44_22]OGY78356.1 MAG: hypothetical protein A2550_00365 [Candidatus Jacksonbacteria bacterium RIFOXYD2_FULL_43_21]HBH46858.1 hypothetical protein [Candidatus Jacksonbacteria bacterium]HCE49079.1 hypothetical protein [Candidatus Jacksonbacteria bacterium]
MKNCQKCKVPLEGWRFKLAHALFGIVPSTKEPDCCNKCEAKDVPQAPAPSEQSGDAGAAN